MPIRSVMRSVIFATALGLSASSVARADPGCNTTEPPTVELDYAEYRGGRNARGINEFLGIRFAAPPVGDLRWRAPEDPEPVADVQDATQYKAVCVGEGQEVVAGVTEEDCLFLNVFTPADAKPDAKLPVWVFIQGGAWKTDANGNNNGTDLIVNSGYDIVHVNINYRVAQLGFLGGLALGDGGGDYNVGLLDQWKALEWVQKYIHLVRYLFNASHRGTSPKPMSSVRWRPGSRHCPWRLCRRGVDQSSLDGLRRCRSWAVCWRHRRCVCLAFRWWTQ